MSDPIPRSTAVAPQARPGKLGLVVRWLWVSVPLTWGTLETVRASLAFFR